MKQTAERILKLCLLSFVVGLFATSALAGAAQFTPPGIAPGSEFRFVFVTSLTYDATDPISDSYNQFVSFIANSAGLNTYGDQPVQWRSITASIAGDPTDPNVYLFDDIPLYNLNGQMVAPSSKYMWGIGPLLNPINRTETNSLLNTFVWTGSGPNGQQTVCSQMGNGCGIASYGWSGATDTTWVAFGQDSQWAQHSIYAFSSVLTAEVSDAPEPAAALLMVAGALSLWLIRQVGQRSRA